MPGTMIIQQGTVIVTRTSKALREPEYMLQRDGQTLCTIRAQSHGWKFWQRTYHTTVEAQAYHTASETSLRQRTTRFLDQAGQCVASEHNRQTLEHGGQRYTLHGWGAIDGLDDASGTRLLSFEWASGADLLQRVQVSQPVSTALLAVATTVALAYGSSAGGG